MSRLFAERSGRITSALAAGAIIAAATFAAPGSAEARRGWWVPGAVIGGLAAGAIIGSAASRPYYYGAPYYGYYGPGPYYGPGCTIRRERVWDGYGWVWQRVRVCY